MVCGILFDLFQCMTSSACSFCHLYSSRSYLKAYFVCLISNNRYLGPKKSNSIAKSTCLSDVQNRRGGTLKGSVYDVGSFIFSRELQSFHRSDFFSPLDTSLEETGFSPQFEKAWLFMRNVHFQNIDIYFARRQKENIGPLRYIDSIAASPCHFICVISYIFSCQFLLLLYFKCFL